MSHCFASCRGLLSVSRTSLSRPTTTCSCSTHQRKTHLPRHAMLVGPVPLLYPLLPRNVPLGWEASSCPTCSPRSSWLPRSRSSCLCLLGLGYRSCPLWASPRWCLPLLMGLLLASRPFP